MKSPIKFGDYFQASEPTTLDTDSVQDTEAEHYISLFSLFHNPANINVSAYQHSKEATIHRMLYELTRLSDNEELSLEYNLYVNLLCLLSSSATMPATLSGRFQSSSSWKTTKGYTKQHQEATWFSALVRSQP